MNEDLLQTIVGRIARLVRTNDPVHVLDPAALREADALAEGRAGDFNALMALGAFHWYRYLLLPPEEDAAALAAALENFGQVVAAIPLPVREQLVRPVPGSSDTPDNPAGSVGDDIAALVDHAVQTDDAALLDRGIDAARRAITALPSDPQQAARYHRLLGRALRARFRHSGQIADLDDAIASLRAEEAATPIDDPMYAGIQANLGSALATRHGAAGLLSDLDEAIGLIEAAFPAFRSNDVAATMAAVNLGNALRECFEATGDAQDIRASIEWLGVAVGRVATNDANRPVILAGPARAHHVRYQRLGDIDDLGAGDRDAWPPAIRARATC